MTKYLGQNVQEYRDALGLDAIELSSPGKGTITVSIQSSGAELCTVCPANGKQDYYSWILSYAPNNLLIETKSLKLWFSDKLFGIPIYAEDLAVKIGSELVEFLDPLSLQFSLTQNIRGGMEISADFFYEQSEKDEYGELAEQEYQQLLDKQTTPDFTQVEAKRLSEIKQWIDQHQAPLGETPAENEVFDTATSLIDLLDKYIDK